MKILMYQTISFSGVVEIDDEDDDDDDDDDQVIII